jgi:hypothetical protein
VEEKLPDLEDPECNTEGPLWGPRACWICNCEHRKDLEEVEKKLENVLSPKVALN